MKVLYQIRSAAVGIGALFFPPVCLCCGRRLLDGERHVCTFCRSDLPFTGQWLRGRNEVYDLFADRVPVSAASSFLYYGRSGRTAALVRNIKFRGRRRAGIEMGRWYGRTLKEESSLYRGADLLIPLPLHPWRKRMRGFNQSECIARGMGFEMGIEVDVSCVIRRRYARPQSRTHDREHRLQNVGDAFAVVCPGKLENRYVILVDDVVTTGATMLSCASAIARAVPSCKIGIAAFTSSPRRVLR